MSALGRARVGCSGWQYREWTGPFYPPTLPARARFAHYAEAFDTVELNTTFYRLPSVAAVEAWAAAAPPGFVYALKLGAFGTHRMKLRDAERWLPNHLDRALRLGPALGPTLVQLPPRWRRDTARLDDFLAAAGRSSAAAGRSSAAAGRSSAAAGGEGRWAIELRDPSWVHDDTFEVLRRHGAALVAHDLPGGLLDRLGRDGAFPRTSDWLYLRLHGPEAEVRPYRGRYGRTRLAPIAEALGEWAASVGDAYAYFNNDVDAAAVADARLLRSLLPGA
jgi:uncharacterized protein YecE (DUF72 family)